VFDEVAAKSPTGWQVICSCHMAVAEIGAYGRLLDQLDQTFTARLVLRGRPPSALQADAPLIGGIS